MKKKVTLAIFSMMILLSMALAACQPAAATDSPVAPDGGNGAAYPEPGAEQAADTEEPGYPAATTEASAGEGATIRVATDATFPPFETIDEATQDIVGFDIDLLNAIAEQNGWTLEITNTPFDPLLIAVEQCQTDLAISAITITEERAAVMLFSDPYINAGQIVVVQSDNTEITGPESLSGKTIGAQLGTTGAEEAQNIEGAEYKPYDTYDLAFFDLMNGQIDAVIGDYPLAMDFVGQNQGALKTVGEVFTDENYGIAACKDRADLVEQINQALQTLKDDGTVAELEQKWLARQGE